MGKVLILEYHNITPGKDGFHRSEKDFRNDLERLYKMGFRPVTASEYLANRMPLAPGSSPVVFTFDDADSSQLKLQKDGSVDPHCGVGIWQVFARSHPDFPVHATFYVLPAMWGQKGTGEVKASLVMKLGSELANHTVTHPPLKRLSDDQVKQELGGASDRLEKFGVKMPPSLALPYGISPKNRALLEGFDWRGKHYSFTGVMLVGAEPALSPDDPKWNRWRVPRIQAYPGESGSDYWLGLVKKGQVKVYVAP